MGCLGTAHLDCQRPVEVARHECAPPGPVARPGRQRSQNKDAKSVTKFPLSAGAPGATPGRPPASGSVSKLPLSAAVVRSASELVSAAAAVDESPYVFRMSAK